MSNHIKSMTINELLKFTTSKYGNSNAIIYKNKTYKYNDLQNMSNSLAKGLMSYGVKRGDKVALWLNNTPEWIFFYYAILKIGAVLVPINTRFKTNELKYILNQSNASFIIVDQKYKSANYFETLKTIIPELSTSTHNKLNTKAFPKLHGVITVNYKELGTISFCELIKNGKDITNEELNLIESQVKPENLCAIFYTSGTTGFPKGVMHSHRMIINMFYVTERFKMTELDNILLFLPLSHVYANQVGLTAACIKGSTIVLMKSFKPEEAINLIEKEKISIMYGFDTMYLDIIYHRNYKDSTFNSLRIGMCSGTKSTLKKIATMTNIKVVNSYGLTEGSGVTSLTFLNDQENTIISTNGYPLPENSVRIIDPVTNKILPNNTYGEIQIKGPSVMLGYYNNMEETQNTLSEDGWLSTGDKAYIDKSGRIHLSGRIKDIIRVGGENVDPSEVDFVLMSHPKVMHSYTVAAPDDRLSEVCVSFVKLKKENNLFNTNELIKYCKSRIAGFKIPKHIFLVNEFPLTSTGKVKKIKLEKLAKNIKMNK